MELGVDDVALRMKLSYILRVFGSFWKVELCESRGFLNLGFL